MKASPLALLAMLFCAVAPLPAADTSRRIAFERGSAIFTANLDGSGAKKTAAGSWPDISPDGTKVAFNTDEPSRKTPTRHIAIADITTGKVTVFKDVPSDNCYGPIWSPDGTRLVFQIYVAEDWHAGLVNADGSGFRYVKKAEPKGHAFYPQCWAADGQSMFFQDMDAILQIGLDGAVLKKWSIHNLVPNGDMSSSSHIAISPDGKTLLMDIEMNEDTNRKGWDGPPPAIWAFDLMMENAVRLTPKGLFAWQPHWLSDTEYVFDSQAAKEKEPSIYRVPLTSIKDRKLILKNGRDASVSR
jgi:TolB protein